MFRAQELAAKSLTIASHLTLLHFLQSQLAVPVPKPSKPASKNCLRLVHEGKYSFNLQIQ
eukprot:c38815_g1_i1 orf=28-207(+)